jgi:hypothetical protein
MPTYVGMEIFNQITIRTRHNSTLVGLILDSALIINDEGVLIFNLPADI